MTIGGIVYVHTTVGTVHVYAHLTIHVHIHVYHSMDDVCVIR